MKLDENGYITHNLTDDGLVSKGLVDHILNKQLIDKQQIQSLNDFKLLQISWVFDLNFSAAIKRVEALGFIPLTKGYSDRGLKFFFVVKGKSFFCMDFI